MAPPQEELSSLKCHSLILRPFLHKSAVVFFRQQFNTKSTRKLSNFNFQWTKTLYQDNLNNIAFFFFTFFKGYRCNQLSVITVCEVWGQTQAWRDRCSMLHIAHLPGAPKTTPYYYTGWTFFGRCIVPKFNPMLDPSQAQIRTNITPISRLGILLLIFCCVYEMVTCAVY